MGTTTTAPKQVIREMAENGYISDIQKWFDALEKRNLSSHSYDKVLAWDVYQLIKLFAPEFSDLDLMLESDEDLSGTVSILRELVEESNFPFKIDLAQKRFFAASYLAGFERDKLLF